DVNAVGDPHTFTVTVLQDDGLTAAQGGDEVGSVTATSGASVSVTLTDSNGAVDVPAGSLSGTTDPSGHFSVTFTSQSAGIVTGHATASLTVSGVSLSRATDNTHGSTGDTVNGFVVAKVNIGLDDVNAVGDPHTFTVTVLQDDGLTAAQGGD